MPTAAITCPTCKTPLQLTIEPAPPIPQPQYPAPPPRGVPAPQPEPVAARTTHPVSGTRPTDPPRQPKRTHKVRHLSPQGTLLSLGVLLLLAAGVTFLAVNWDTLPVALQAGIIGTLAALAFAGSVPASRRSLAGTAEALAILGCGLLTVDLYGARTLGLVSLEAIDWSTYSAIVFGVLALINLLMTRVAPKVVTYGVTTVIAGQLPATADPDRPHQPPGAARRSAGPGRHHADPVGHGHRHRPSYRRDHLGRRLLRHPPRRHDPNLRRPAGHLLRPHRPGASRTRS